MEAKNEVMGINLKEPPKVVTDEIEIEKQVVAK